MILDKISFKKNRIANVKNHKNNNENNYYVIENIPYTGQETTFYCHYACLAMIFQYYGIKTMLQEITFNSGIGYSLMYPNPRIKYFPVAGNTISQSFDDCKFLADLYNLSYEYWNKKIYPSDDQNWQKYLNFVKQNIQQDIPVKTTVNYFYLISFKKESKKIFKFNINRLFRWLYIFLLPNMHDILLVGFNEDEESVCYIDPAITLFRKSENKYYQWIGIKHLRTAIRTAKLKNIAARYSIEIFKKKNITSSKKNVFKKAHQRNIKKMEGNHLVYNKIYKNYEFGINALKQLKIELENELTNNLTFKFKLNCLRYFLIYIISLLSNNRFSKNELKYFNPYGEIAVEKQNLIKYLIKNKNLLRIYPKEIKLLTKEFENWTNLITYFSKLIKKNIFLKKSYTNQLLKNIIIIIDNIILTEEKIININKEKYDIRLSQKTIDFSPQDSYC